MYSNVCIQRPHVFKCMHSEATCIQMYAFRGHMYSNACIQKPHVFEYSYVFKGHMYLSLCIQRSHDGFNYIFKYFRSIQVFVLSY